MKSGLTALLLGLCAVDVATEQVTLTTYYPAPSGVYERMVTSGDAYLASAGGRVGVGTTAPGAKLHVRGDVIVEGNILMTGAIGGYRGSSAPAAAAPDAFAGSATRPASPAAPLAEPSGIYGLCQELAGFPTPAQMSCGKNTLAIAPASCEAEGAESRCACPPGYELVALGVTMPMMLSVKRQNFRALGLKELLNERIPAPVISYSCLKK